MIRQYLLLLLLSCWLVSPSHAEETYDSTILEELRAAELAEKEANAENASDVEPEGGRTESLENTQSGSGIIKADIQKNETSVGDFDSPDVTINRPKVDYNQVDDEESEESTDASIEADTDTSDATEAEATAESDSADINDSETTSTAGDTSTVTGANSTQTATDSTTNAETTPLVDNVTSDTSSTSTATNSETSSDSTTDVNNATSNTPNVVVNVPSQPIMSINSEFADHWIDTRPQTAVIIELKQDSDDDPRFFYLYSDITGQAGYSIDTGNGTVAYNGDGTVTYTANSGFSGTDTFFYAYNGWDYGRGGYGRGSGFSSYGYGWQDYGYWNYGQGWGYGISDADIAKKSRYYSKRKRKGKVRVSKHLGSPIGPTICQIYAVHDEGASDSQFVKFEVIDLKEKRTVSQRLGQEYKGFDIEAIAIHPITAMLYAASKDLLYLVHPSEASLKVVGEIGYDEITGFAFHPKDSTLFAATDTDDKDKQKGILQIDPDTGASKMILPSSYEIEALAWNVEGTILYAAEKTKRPNENGVMIRSSNLIAWYYDGTRLLGQGYEDSATTRSTRSTRSDTSDDTANIAEQQPADASQVLPDSSVDFLRLGLNVIGSVNTGRDIEISAEVGAGGDSPITVCEGFGEIEGEVESLETRADGLLLFSVDQGRGNKIYAFNPKTCQVEEATSFGTPYSDIEAIAWPIHCQSSTVPVPKGWDLSFIGSNGSFCIEEGKPFEIKGKAKFSSKGFLNLKTSWEVVVPENAKCPEISEESGLANLGNLINCPKEALKSSQMLTGSSDFSITAWWPGLTDARGRYYDTIEVHFTAELFDMLGKPMRDYLDNNINGSSIATRSVIATAEICKPPEPLSPSQLLNEFFINDYAIKSDGFSLSSDSLSVVIEGRTYSGEMTQAMLTAIEQGIPSSSFQDENLDGVDDLVLLYPDGTQQILFAEPNEQEVDSNDSVESEQSEASNEEQDDTSELAETDTTSDTESTDTESTDTEATEEDATEEEQAIEEDTVEVSEEDALDFSEYATKFDEYLQLILSQDEYDFSTNGLLSLISNNTEYLGQLSKQPIDEVEPFEGDILFGELTQDEQDAPYFPITFPDGQVFALYYLGEADSEQSDTTLDEETGLEDEDSTDDDFDASEQEADSTDDDLDASEQEADSTDDDFDASEQEVDSTDDDFDASEQEIDSTDDDFDASEQEVDYSDDDFDASDEITENESEFDDSASTVEADDSSNDDNSESETEEANDEGNSDQVIDTKSSDTSDS